MFLEWNQVGNLDLDFCLLFICSSKFWVETSSNGLLENASLEISPEKFLMNSCTSGFRMLLFTNSEIEFKDTISIRLVDTMRSR